MDWKDDFPKENRYFETENGILYHGDCVEMLQKFPNNTIDLIVTSPPYDDLRTYECATWNFSVFQAISNNIPGVMIEGGRMVWIVSDATNEYDETGTSFRQALYFKDNCGLKLNDTMIYAKAGNPSPPTKERYHNIFEYMFIFSKGIPKTFNPIKDRKHLHAGTTRISTRRKKDGSLSKSKPHTTKLYGKRSNIWTYSTGFSHSSKDKIAFKHPAIFPEKLAGDHIKSWSNENDIVLDMFFGSGTTGIACEKLNRRWIGIEISKKYCEISKKRILENIGMF